MLFPYLEDSGFGALIIIIIIPYNSNSKGFIITVCMQNLENTPD